VFAAASHLWPICDARHIKTCRSGNPIDPGSVIRVEEGVRGADVKAADEDAYREYVTARMDRLRRAAYLMSHDWHTADDLVSVTIDKLYRYWRQARAATSMDAYVHRILANSWLDERRRPWRREVVTDRVPDRPVQARPDVADRPLLHLLRTLTPRRRAAIVLRFYSELTVAETADALGCSAGTVKSLTSRGISDLRDRIGTDHGAAVMEQ
jgi:RNA polymerase sigma-70 factor (sigma-E family)